LAPSSTVTLPVLERAPRPGPKPVRLLRQHLYIEPTSVCNLHCKMCYSNVINGASRKVLAGDVILDFAQRFLDATTPPIDVYWCGTGEVFLHPEFPRLANRLLEYGPAVEQIIQTNGTTPRRLDELTSLERLSFRVSIDGHREFQDWHRGAGTYERNIAFCRRAVELKCRSLHIRCLLTRGNIDRLDEFEDDLKERIGPQVTLSMFTIFTNKYLDAARPNSPLINRKQIDDSPAITTAEARPILARKYGDRFQLVDEDDAVDNYLSLNPYGVYTCCNGVIKVGEPDTDMNALIQRMLDSETDCLACALFPCQ
jgi:sulfatase maturation enzyme AslB (radical SAM superfamily)